jgi:NAD(P)H-quinone oxidoreductase subunit 5
MVLDAPEWRSMLLLGMPAACAVAAIAVAVARPSPAAAWTLVRSACAIALGAAILSLLAFIAAGAAVLPVGPLSLLRTDAAGAVVLTLVAFIGWVIAGYSRRCLEGEPAQVRYAMWLMATLAGVGGVVISNDLLALAACWMIASGALQRLLLFHEDRPAARIAAHKKLIANRLSELFLFAAIGLLWTTLDTLRIDAILAHPALSAPGGAPFAVHLAMVLVVLAALLKCALLPFHGWLIQVMEAPTPVSALLHAGVVNLGGFVLIRLSGLLDAVPAAQVLLVVAGTTTAVLAALVMTTRISIKVSLAWSTCAQMGFMLMQVGLGAYALALLHLVAHSLYKAHAFLSAGDTVHRTAALALAERSPQERMSSALAAALAAAGLMAAAQHAWAWLYDAPAVIDPVQWALAAVACLVLAPLLVNAARGAQAQPLLLLLSACAVALAYAGMHQFGSGWMPGRAAGTGLLPWLLAAAVLAAFAALYLLQAAIRSAPASPLARRLHPWFYAGLFLDERTTRAGFRAWPLHTPGSRP